MSAKWIVIATAAGLQLVVFAGLLWVAERDVATPRIPARLPLQTPDPIRPRVAVLSSHIGQPVSGSGWRLIGQLSAHYALILEVETESLGNLKGIAHTLIEPVHDAYVEVLVYFYQEGVNDGLAVRRVQWTEEGGYVEMNLQP